MSRYEPQVGDRVRVVLEGVVTSGGATTFAIDVGGDFGGISYAVSPGRPGVVSVERLPDPEPTWQPGDVARDALGRICLAMPGRDGLWWRTPGACIEDADLPRPLTPLVKPVTP